MIGIARNNVLHEHQRTRRKHHDNRFIEDLPNRSRALSQPDIADMVTNSLVSRSIWAHLTSDDQELVNLAFVRGLSTSDAAALLGISATAYTTRLSRTRQRIVAMNTQACSDSNE